MARGLSGKVVIVTGAASGMGREATLQFVAAGARVVICDIQRVGAEQTALMADGSGDSVAVVVGDVADPSLGAEAVGAALSRWSRVDVLCNNAGMMDQMQPVTRTTLDAWERIMRVNATGPFLMSQAALPHMIAQRRGVIINIASEAGLRGGAAGAAYTASKHALVGLTKNISAMHRRDGVRCNAICPGATSTNIMDTTLGPMDPEGAAALQPALASMGPAVHPSEIASAVVFLASDAAGAIDGAILPVDSGWAAT